MKLNNTNWKWKKLGEVCDIYNGSTPSRVKADYWKGNILWATPTDVSKLNDKYIYDTKDKITKEGYESCSTHLLPIGSVIFTSRASIGHIAITKKELCTNQGFKNFVCKKQLIIPEYLYFCLKLNKHEIENLGSGSTFKEVSMSSIKNFEIPVPPLPIQQKIVSILERAEILKQKREQANEEANKIIQSMFYKMFGKIKLDDYNTKLFEIIDGDRGVNYPKSSDFLNEGYCLFLSTKNVRSYGFLLNECVFINKQKDEQLRKGKLERNDIVLTTRGTVGNVALYDETIPYNIIRINSGMVLIRPNLDLLLPKYLLYLIQMPIIKNQYLKLVSGSAQPQLPIAILKKIKLLVPPLPLQNQFASIVEKIESIKRKQNKATAEINTLFDALMQKAFKGELVD